MGLSPIIPSPAPPPHPPPSSGVSTAPHVCAFLQPVGLPASGEQALGFQNIVAYLHVQHFIQVFSPARAQTPQRVWERD